MTRAALILAIATLAVFAAALMGAPIVTSQGEEYVVKYVNQAIPMDPADAFWGGVEGVEVSLTSQMLAYPMKPGPETRTLVFKAVHNGTHVAFYLEWSDDTEDVPGPGQLDAFPDAVALQFPVREGEQPYICMGMVDSPVNIVYWRSTGEVQMLVAGAGYGLSPRHREALGLNEEPISPIELLPPETQVAVARAVYGDGKWRVVIIRPMGSTYELVPSFAPGKTTYVAFAQWDGSRGERGGNKVTSGWVTIRFEEATRVVTREVVKEVVREVEKPVERPAEERVVERRVEVIPAWVYAVIGVLVVIIVVLGVVALRRRK